MMGLSLAHQLLMNSTGGSEVKGQRVHLEPIRLDDRNQLIQSCDVNFIQTILTNQSEASELKAAGINDS